MSAPAALRALPGGARRTVPCFGVDTNLFIYHFENHPELSEPVGRFLEKAEEGGARLVTSTITLMEVLVVPKRHGFGSLCQRYRDLLASFPNLEVVAIDAEVAEIAADLRASYPLRPPDALQLAAAIHKGAGAFVSEDRRMRRVSEIEILSVPAALALI